MKRDREDETDRQMFVVVWHYEDGSWEVWKAKLASLSEDQIKSIVSLDGGSLTKEVSGVFYIGTNVNPIWTTVAKKGFADTLEGEWAELHHIVNIFIWKPVK